MTRLRSTIAATLLAGVALIAPAAAHAADSPELLIPVGISVADLDDDVVVIELAKDVVVVELGEQPMSLQGWGWGG